MLNLDYIIESIRYENAPKIVGIKGEAKPVNYD